MKEHDSRSFALVTNKDLTVIGGQEQAIKYLLGFNAKWTYISPHLPPEPFHPEIVLQTNSDSSFLGVHLPLATPKEMKRINANLRDTDPEAIIIDGTGPYGISVFMQLPKDLQQRTYAIWRNMMNAPFSLSEDSPARKVLRTVQRRVQTYVMRNVTANLVVSNAVGQSLREIGIPENKIKVIPQQIGREISPLERFKDQQQGEYKNTFRAKFLDADELGILFVGRMVPEKGLNWVVGLYEQLRSERKHVLQHEGLFKKVKLTIVGPVTERDQAYFEEFMKKMEHITLETEKNYSADSVTFNFIGPKSKDQLQYFYNAYDVLFMPSANVEGFGRTTVEAMMGGMTVIGRSEALATRELLSAPPYTVGSLVCSPQEAAKEIISFMQRPEKLTEFKYNALLWGNSHFSLGRAEQGLWDAIEQSR